MRKEDALNRLWSRIVGGYTLAYEGDGEPFKCRVLIHDIIVEDTSVTLKARATGCSWRRGDDFEAVEALCPKVIEDVMADFPEARGLLVDLDLRVEGRGRGGRVRPG